MAASQRWFLALLVVGTSCFWTPIVAGHGAVYRNSPGGHEVQHGTRRSLEETNPEKPPQVDVAVAVSALLERRLEDIHEEKLQGDVSKRNYKPLSDLSFYLPYKPDQVHFLKSSLSSENVQTLADNICSYNASSGYYF